MSTAADAVARCVAWHKLHKQTVLAADTLCHTCTPACNHWVDTRTRRSVCTKSLHVHECGDGCTAERVVLPRNEGFMCPYTHIVFKDAPLVQTPLFNKDGRCINHWAKHGPQARKAVRPRAVRVLTYRVCVRIAMGMVHGKTRSSIREVEVSRATKRLRKAMKAAAPSTFAQYAAVVTRHTQSVSPTTSEADATVLVARVCRAIYNYTSAHPGCVFGTHDVTVATWLTMLSDGMQHEGVEVVPCVQQLRRMMPPPSLMVMVPRVNCRAISVARRKFLKYVYAPSGLPRFNRVFTL